MIPKTTSITEIQRTNIPSRRTSWKHFDVAPEWRRYKLLDKKFGPFIAISHEWSSYDRFIVILDPSKFKTPSNNERKSHEIKGIDQDIPASAIVGGIELALTKVPIVNQKCYTVDYLALNPKYQGQNLALKLYLWLLNNSDVTKVGIIEAGSNQSLGGMKLWKKLVQYAFVFAYSPHEKQFSQVELNADGDLEADFALYEDPRELEKLEKEYDREQDKIEWFHSTKQQYRTELEKIEARYKKSIDDLDSAWAVRMFATKRK